MLHQNQKPGLTMRIYHQPIDVCPLCSKQIDVSKGNGIKVESGGRLIFYAHRDCVKVMSEFLKQIREKV